MPANEAIVRLTKQKKKQNKKRGADLFSGECDALAVQQPRGSAVSSGSDQQHHGGPQSAHHGQQQRVPGKKSQIVSLHDEMSLYLCLMLFLILILACVCSCFLFFALTDRLLFSLPLFRIWENLPPDFARCDAS